ncbi:hypothetical protein M0805_007918 [Coniferiporia weirii]|nr:hypothetical protein M0805_007918 [Coniferiporia weirii]
MGWGRSLQSLPYGDLFRKHRRMMQKYFGQQAVTSFRSTQEIEVRRLLQNLLAKPDDFIGHIHRFITGVLLMVTYGHEVVSDDDELIRLVEQAMFLSSSVGTVGVRPLDVFPFLRRVPAWIPGMGLKRFAVDVRKLVERVKVMPFVEVEKNRAAGTARPCIVTSLLDEYEGSNTLNREHEEDMMTFSQTIYNGGAHTTKSTLTTFFMMMVLYPEVAKRAQEEIDNVIGTDRLPTLDDRQRLPYIDCILKEVFRLYPSVPTGLPHQSTQAEVYRGWMIPEKSIVFANIWQLMRDEKHFPNPEAFVPERHAHIPTANGSQSGEDNGYTEGDDPSSIVFGFGRRVCPGKFFAESMLWMVFANVLASFDIEPYEDPVTGAIALPTCEFENEVIRSPKAFKCTIAPRSAKHAQLIQSVNPE